MKVPFAGAIDCDVHPAVPGMAVLLPYLDEYWRDQITNRYIDRMAFTLSSTQPTLPINGRDDWRPASGLPGSDLDMLRRQALDAFGSRIAICNTIHGAVGLFNEDMAAAIVGAVNDWVAQALLDSEPRLRASILLPPQDPALAAAEIERLAGDARFVQVLLLVMGDLPLGRRMYWPIYQAAEKYRLPVCIHAGGNYRHAPTGAGWPSFHVEDYVAQSAAFENVLLSLLAEGVFSKFPDLKVVLAESGVTWLPQFLWRNDKIWRGVRPEVPWIDRVPREIVRDHVRLTLQPFDGPADPQRVARAVEHLDCDRFLLFSTDYPHWHFDGDEVLPDGLPADIVCRLMVDNPLETYPRLAAGTGGGQPASRPIP